MPRESHVRPRRAWPSPARWQIMQLVPALLKSLEKAKALCATPAPTEEERKKIDALRKELRAIAAHPQSTVRPARASSPRNRALTGTLATWARGAGVAVIPHVTSQEAYVEAIIEREDARKRTGLFGSASPVALDAKVESARLTAKVDIPYVRSGRAGETLADCLKRAAHAWPHTRTGPAPAARWTVTDYQVLYRLPSLANTRKKQLAAELAKVSAQLASLKATFDSGAAAHDSKTAASLNRRMAKQRQLGEGAYQRYLAWNQQVTACRRPLQSAPGSSARLLIWVCVRLCMTDPQASRHRTFIRREGLAGQARPESLLGCRRLGRAHTYVFTAVTATRRF